MLMAIQLRYATKHLCDFTRASLRQLEGLEQREQCESAQTLPSRDRARQSQRLAGIGKSMIYRFK